MFRSLANVLFAHCSSGSRLSRLRISIDAYTRKSKFHSTRLVAGASPATAPYSTNDGRWLTGFPVQPRPSRSPQWPNLLQRAL